jgi:cyclic pyranopterin phosphate synthase
VGSTIQVGLITSITKPFCADCNRARLSSDGKFFTCLFASKGTDMLGPMRNGASDQEMLEKIAAVWLPRNDRYSELRGVVSDKKAEMSYLGG